MTGATVRPAERAGVAQASRRICGCPGARVEARARSRLLGPLKVLSAAALIVVTSACSPFDDVMAAIFGRSMRSQNSFDPYENPLPPAENSVPFAAANFPAEPGQLMVGQPEGMAQWPPAFDQGQLVRQEPVVVDMVNPMAATPESLARGEELFLRFCAPCHGPDGMGVTGYIIPAGYPLIFSLVSDVAMGYSDGYLYGIIRVGRGLMPAYGPRLTHYDRWNIVNYVRQLQGVPAGADAQAPAADTAQAVPE